MKCLLWLWATLHTYIACSVCVWRVSCDPSPMLLPNFIVLSEEYCSLRTQHELYTLVKVLVSYHMLSLELPEQSPNLS